MWETQVRSLGQEDSLEKEMANPSSILAWKSPWTEESWQATVLWSQKSRTQLSSFTATHRDSKKISGGREFGDGRERGNEWGTGDS